MTDRSQEQTLVALVENEAGVLARVVGLFARRGFNICSLAVAPTEDPRFSRIKSLKAKAYRMKVSQADQMLVLI